MTLGQLGNADPGAIREAGLGAGRVTMINESTRQSIRQLVKEAIDKGMSPREAGDLIEGWTGFDEYRAERIARTELMFAYNAAAIGTYKEHGITHVQAIDGDTDPECLDRDGRVFSVNEAADTHDHPNGTLDWVPVVNDMGAATTVYEERAPVEPDYYQPAALPGRVDMVTARTRANQIHRAGTHPGGDAELSALYEQQGFDRLPQVLSKAELDSFVAKGEQELYRGMRNLGDDIAEQYRTGAYYPGTGIYGNGTYTAEAVIDGIADAGLRVAQHYAGNNGYILRMTIRSDAKVITYQDAAEGARRAALALEEEKHAITRALAEFRTELHARAEYQFSHLKTLSDDAANALLKERAAIYDKEFERVAIRQDAIDSEISFVSDPGRWATSEGYDAINVATQDPYWVILNRSATRVQRS